MKEYFVAFEGMELHRGCTFNDQKISLQVDDALVPIVSGVADGQYDIEQPDGQNCFVSGSLALAP